PFAVLAIMENMSTSTDGAIHDETGSSLLAMMRKQSDGKADLASLDLLEYGEHVTIVEEQGGMRGLGLGDHGFLVIAEWDHVDQHGTPIEYMRASGRQKIQQTHSMVSHRTGSADIPVTNSGFSIIREVVRNPDGGPNCLEFLVTKDGEAGSV